MGSTTKRLRFLEEDRISNLPEHLISHILSFLPTKYAVGTSALSTFWKKQWTSIPNLDFDNMLFMDSQTKYFGVYVQRTFQSFVTRVLYLHEAPKIYQFRLKLDSFMSNASLLDSWISVALSRKVQNINLEFFLHDRHPVISQIFTCSTLVELRLGSRLLLNIPALVRLPSLKAIYLDSCKFKDNESPNRLFSNCKVLENITIMNCEWGNNRLLYISSPTVKRLAVNSLKKFAIELDTPHLERLDYARHTIEGFILKSREFFAKVYFHIPYNYRGICKTRKVLAEGVSKVQSLYLSGEVLGSLKFIFQPFPNLRTLVVGYNKEGAWQVLPLLLQISPNLKNLELNDGLFGQECLGEFKWVPPEIVPACMLLHLEGIIIHEFKGDAEEVSMIEYFLMNARVLKKFTIKSAMDVQKEREISTRLLNYKGIVSLCKS